MTDKLSIEVFTFDTVVGEMFPVDASNNIALALPDFQCGYEREYDEYMLFFGEELLNSMVSFIVPLSGSTD